MNHRFSSTLLSSLVVSGLVASVPASFAQTAKFSPGDRVLHKGKVAQVAGVSGTNYRLYYTAEKKYSSPAGTYDVPEAELTKAAALPPRTEPKFHQDDDVLKGTHRATVDARRTKDNVHYYDLYLHDTDSYEKDVRESELTKAPALDLNKLKEDIIKEHNLVRANPAAYASHLKQIREREVERRMAGGESRASAEDAIDSAIKDLSADGKYNKPLPALRGNEKLGLAAQKHANWLAQHKDIKDVHVGPGPTDTVFTRMSKEGYIFAFGSENIGPGPTAKVIVRSFVIDWGNKAANWGHRNNILRPDQVCTEIGIGVNKTVVINFAKPK